jgi:hypothetical protein
VRVGAALGCATVVTGNVDLPDLVVDAVVSFSAAALFARLLRSFFEILSRTLLHE